MLDKKVLFQDFFIFMGQKVLIICHFIFERVKTYLNLENLIVVDKKNRIVLYHKNDFTTDKDHLSEISGYHLQGDARRNSIVTYLQYIVDHDYYRMLNPVYIPKKKKDSPPPRKGTKRYKSTQRRIEKYERKRAIKNVLNLIESLNIPASQMPAMAAC